MSLTDQPGQDPRAAEADGLDSRAESPTPRARLGLRAAVTCLVVGAVLNTASAITGRIVLSGYGDEPAALVDAVRARAGLATLSQLLDVAAVPLMLVGTVGVALHLRGSRIARWAAAIAGVGFLGYLVLLGAQIASLAVAQSLPLPAAREAVAAQQQSGLLGLVGVLPFLAGTFVGLALLAVAVWRSRVAPRWVPVVMAAFLIIDFAATEVPWFDPHLLWLAAVSGLAAALWNRPEALWERTES